MERTLRFQTSLLAPPVVEAVTTQDPAACTGKLRKGQTPGATDSLVDKDGLNIHILRRARRSHFRTRRRTPFEMQSRLAKYNERNPRGHPEKIYTLVQLLWTRRARKVKRRSPHLIRCLTAEARPIHTSTDIPASFYIPSKSRVFHDGLK